MVSREQIIQIARKYYATREIARAIASYAKNREVVAKYYDKFGKRPNTIEYENDVIALVKSNATSFHCSVELWKNPLELARDISEEKLNELRIGWDLLLDVDCAFIDYSKEAAKLIVKALEWHGIKNYGIKFSGGKGFHIGLSHEVFPEKIVYAGKEMAIKDFFPTGPRIIASYISGFIEKELREVILSMNSVDEIAKALKKPEQDLLIEGKFNPYTVVGIDTILMSSRHLYRMPYSLHEKTGLVSVVLSKQQLNAFKLSMGKPSAVIIKPFLTKPKINSESEAHELIINALDWQSKEKLIPEIEQLKAKIDYSYVKPITIKGDISNAYCGCIKKALEGIKHDGRKRALFVLMCYFRALNFEFEKIEEIVRKWNEKNYKPLSEAYIKGQLNWHKKQTKTILPPNHDVAAYYKDIGILSEECSKAKNPLAYTIKILKQNQREHGARERTNEKAKGKKITTDKTKKQKLKQMAEK